MTAPPGLAPNLSNREARPGAARQEEHLSVQTLTREARKVMAEMEMDLSQNRLVKIVRRYIDTGQAGGIDFRTYVLGYADPTGETAVRHVVKARGF